MKVNAMTLRQLLNQLQAAVNDDLTEDQLLDLPIKVHIPSGSAQYTTITSVRDASVQKKTEFSKAEQRVTVKDIWIDLNTSPSV